MKWMAKIEFAAVMVVGTLVVAPPAFAATGATGPGTPDRLATHPGTASNEGFDGPAEVKTLGPAGTTGVTGTTDVTHGDPICAIGGSRRTCCPPPKGQHRYGFPCPKTQVVKGRREGAGVLPFTGFGLLVLAALAAGLIASGLEARRRAGPTA